MSDISGTTWEPPERDWSALAVGVLVIALLYRGITAVGRLTVVLWVGMLVTVLWVIVSGLAQFQSRSWRSIFRPAHLRSPPDSSPDSAPPC